MKSKRTREFCQLCDALPSYMQRQADKAFAQFQRDPDHSGLHFKPVGGNPIWYSARIGIGYRAICILAEDEIYVWFWIGSHADYDQLLKQR